MITAVHVRDGSTADCRETPAHHAFGLWSQVYDDAPNPLLAVERRFLQCMLPDVRGLNLLDAGCGTGRWLTHLAAQSPKSLIGVDASSQMLARASAKSIPNADLRLADCAALPVQDSSVDLALASFVLSYVRDLEKFAAELARVACPNSTLFLTDMHPKTASVCNWKRSFNTGDAVLEIETHDRSLRQIASIFRATGFTVLSLLEPTFGAPERTIFERGKKLEAWKSSSGLPAIYILQMRRAEKASPPRRPLSRRLSSVQLTGARCAFGGQESLPAAVSVGCGRVLQISSRLTVRQHRLASLTGRIDLAGYLVLPGLINAHDHLEFGLFPNLGGPRYESATAWARDIHRVHARTIERHRRVPKDVRLWWGAIRNLLCGVTTVCHHNPLTPALLDPGFPIHVLPRFGWAHSLAMDPEAGRKFHAAPPDAPFILHLAEGTDRECVQEILDLDRMGALGERTVLVHGLALSRKGISLLNRRGAALVVCPTSNRFLFGRVHTRELLSSVENLALGSDSPLTAAGDLLDEIHFAHSTIGLEPEHIYEMVAARPARMLRLMSGEGRLHPGGVANLIAIRDRGASPAATVAGLSSEDIALVMVSGRVQLACPDLLDRIPAAQRRGLHLLEVDGQIRWIRAPLQRLFAETEKFLGADIRLGGKRLRYAGPA